MLALPRARPDPRPLSARRRLQRRAVGARGVARAGADAHGFTRADTSDGRSAGRRREPTPARRPAGLRGCEARAASRATRTCSCRARTASAIWDTAAYAFVDGRRAGEREPEPLAPGEAERHARALRGREGIYQVRGYDVSNMTLIRGRHRLDRRGPAHQPGDRRGRARARARAARRRARSSR